MTREEAKQFGLSLLHGIAVRNTGEYAENVKLAIEALSEPSLPSNLNEAAEKFGLEYAPIISGEALDLSGQCYETDDVDWPSRCGFIKGFKAGAEWIAKQGNVYNCYLKKSRLRGFLTVNIVLSNFDWYEGEEVVVQVRKK